MYLTLLILKSPVFVSILGAKEHSSVSSFLTIWVLAFIFFLLAVFSSTFAPYKILATKSLGSSSPYNFPLRLAASTFDLVEIVGIS
jgi:hypothetical protein